MEDRVIPVSHSDKLLFPDSGITKAGLADYYQRIAPIMLPFLENRPITLKHHPRGVEEPGYYRKNIPKDFPGYLKRVAVPRHTGNDCPDVQMATIDEADDLRFLTGQNVIEYHLCTAQVGALNNPDQLIINLDPHDCDFFRVRTVALFIKDVLQDMGIASFPKLSGRDGLHLHIPVKPDAAYETIRPWLKQLVDRICDDIPRLATHEHLKRKRGARVYVGIASNSYAQCIVAPYSVRAQRGAPIAAPVSWLEIASQKIFPGQIHVGNIFRRLSHRTEPWANMRLAAPSAAALCR